MLVKGLKRVIKTSRALYFSLFSFSSLINIVGLMLYYKKCAFKAIGKQMKCVFSIVLLMLYYKKCMFKANGNLLFRLLNYFYNMKNVCLKHEGGGFLIYSATSVIRKHVCSNGGGQVGGCFFQFVRLIL